MAERIIEILCNELTPPLPSLQAEPLTGEGTETPHSSSPLRGGFKAPSPMRREGGDITPLSLEKSCLQLNFSLDKQKGGVILSSRQLYSLNPKRKKRLKENEPGSSERGVLFSRIEKICSFNEAECRQAQKTKELICWVLRGLRQAERLLIKKFVKL